MNRLYYIATLDSDVGQEKKSNLIISFVGSRKVPKINKHRAFDKAVGLGKNPPNINVFESLSESVFKLRKKPYEE